ncbi:MAG: site-specific DNA-methyltransferase [Firmicutes bacterium]|nr:site-specific DNA-methyltransferase [Bacillota bacterium]
MAAANLEKIAALFPHVITETTGSGGNDHKVVDLEQLRQELLAVIFGDGERCRFTWPGQKEAILLANTPAAKTLRPAREESLHWETTENLYLEGDNLEALKILQETYLNSIKCIYIDPPYNTGKDLIYKDDFRQDKKGCLSVPGQAGAIGNRLFKNVETTDRFHSAWLNMIYPRLILARKLLRPDGIIFISIDDGEVHNLRKVCDEVFGERNFVACITWANKEGGGRSDCRLFRIKHEYIICYAQDIEKIKIIGVPVSNAGRYRLADKYVKTRGKYYLQKLGMGSIRYSPTLDYPIVTPAGTTVMPADNNKGRKACWRWSRRKFAWGQKNGFITIKKDKKGIWTVYTKQYLNCDHEGNLITRTQRPLGVIDNFSNTQAAKLLNALRLGNCFSYPKPVELIAYLINRVIAKEGIILDFFAGSATTAHAVMQLNAEDGGNRRYIMVQLPEPCPQKSEAYRAGFKNIAEIGKERIRRAAQKIRTETGADIDYGFRVFKVD